jgi:hypothetical protein
LCLFDEPGLAATLLPNGAAAGAHHSTAGADFSTATDAYGLDEGR